MDFSKDKLFWVFNEGNNRQALFRDDGDYFEFLLGLHREVAPLCHVVVWCLVPQSFSLLLRATEESALPLKQGSLTISRLADGFRRATLVYGRYHNRRYHRRGAVIRPKTRSVEVPFMMDWGVEGFHREAFAFIHQQPVKLGLVHSLADWPHSSFSFYCGTRKQDFCNELVAREMFGYVESGFIELVSRKPRREFVEFVERAGW